MDAVNAMAVALLLAVTNQKVIDFLMEPVRKRFPDADLWWVTYLSLVTGLLITYLSGVNLFVAFMPSAPLAGVVLTGVLVGGGASLIHDIFDNLPTGGQNSRQ